MKYNLQTFTAFNRQLYVAELIQLDKAETAYQNFLSAEELKVLAKRKHKKAEYIFSRFIIKKIVGISREQAILTTVKYCQTLKTAGVFREQKLEKKLSLSHSGRFVAVSFCSLADDIGIDIEMFTNRDVKPLVAEFFSEQDKQQINSATNAIEQFYKLWTEKEAVTKLVNASIFTLMATSSNELHQQYHLNSIFHDDFIVSIATKK